MISDTKTDLQILNDYFYIFYNNCFKFYFSGYLIQLHLKHPFRRQHPRQHQGDRPELQPTDRGVHQERVERAEDRSTFEHGRNWNHDGSRARDSLLDPPQPLSQLHLRSERGNLEQTVTSLTGRFTQRHPKSQLRIDRCLDQIEKPEVSGHFGKSNHIRHQRRFQVPRRIGDAQDVSVGQVHQGGDGVLLEPEEPSRLRDVQLAQGRFHGCSRYNHYFDLSFAS